MRQGGIALAAAALAIGWAGAAAAQAGMDQIKARYTAAYKACTAAPSGQTTMGAIQCATDEYDRQNKPLNAAYEKSMAQLGAQEQASLKAAELAWIAFRNADCASQGDQGLGTLQRVLANQCMVDRTIERTIELENFPVNMAGPGG